MLCRGFGNKRPDHDKLTFVRPLIKYLSYAGIELAVANAAASCCDQCANMSHNIQTTFDKLKFNKNMN